MSVFTYENAFGGVSGEALFYNMQEAIENGAKDAILDWAIKVAEEASAQAPVDTGQLRRSVDITEVDDGYNIAFNAYNPIDNYNYAYIQHENAAYNHPKGGKAFYLIDPLLSMQGELRSTLDKYCSRYLESAIRSGSIPSSPKVPESFGEVSVVNNTTSRPSKKTKKNESRRKRNKAKKKARRGR